MSVHVYAHVGCLHIYRERARAEKFSPNSCSAIMDLKVVFVIVCLSALAITSTDAGIPKCCIGVKDKLQPRLLYKADRWYLQDDSGACDIKALLVYVSGKPICINPKWKPLLEKFIARRQQIEKKNKN